MAGRNVGEMDLLRTSNYSPNIQVAVRTLTIGGFTLEKATRNPSFALIYAYRYDEFGVKQQYCFAIFEDPPAEDEIESAKIGAGHNNTELVIISPSPIQEKVSIEWARFLNLFGGPVFSYSPLETEFGEQIKQLGFNKLPAGLEGKPDDLFELYTHKALEFIFGCKVNRYGQERRFEAYPDGVILKANRFTALYDTKAYSDGYDVDSNSIRQFGSYVTDFQYRYSQVFDLNAFIVISGAFPSSADALENRSRQLLSETRVPLVFLTAESIVQIINLLSAFPAARRAINWRKIFVHPVVTPNLIQKELDAINKDKIVPKSKR